MSVRLYLNSGNVTATENPSISTLWFTPSPSQPRIADGTPLLVDVNGDGWLDVPSVGYFGVPMVQSRDGIPMSPVAIWARLRGRNGWLNQQGATVCVHICGYDNLNV